MSLTNPYRQKNYMGEFADAAAALTFIQANKWDSSGDGAGDPQAGMQYFNTAVSQVYLYTGSAWVSMGGGVGAAVFSKAVQFTRTVAGSSDETGSVNLGLLEGAVYSTLVEMTFGTTTNADVELADASFAGSPNILYQIGSSIWDPSISDWHDRNAWGFLGLSSTGILYWRLTNNSATSMDFRVTIKATGSEVVVSP